MHFCDRTSAACLPSRAVRAPVAMAKLRGLRVDAPVLLLLLASTHSTPLSCAPASSFLNGTCLPNPSAHLGPKYSSCASASACCASCAAAGAACESWSWWGGNKCALFSTVGVPKTVAGCVSGAMHSPPAPAPQTCAPLLPCVFTDVDRPLSSFVLSCCRYGLSMLLLGIYVYVYFF